MRIKDMKKLVALLGNEWNLGKKDNIKKLQIVTDESCSYRIYEKVGCIKVYETIVENKEFEQYIDTPQERAFVYEKDL